MGLVMTAQLVCDKCSTTISIQNADSPTPDGWMRHSGYANISGGASTSLNAYYCNTCIATYGTRNLVKNTADITECLTTPA